MNKDHQVNPKLIDIVYRALSILKNSNEKIIFDCLWNLESSNLNESFTSCNFEIYDKSEEEANRLRNEGNKCYAAKNLEKALELYNLSIMSSPHPLIENEDLSHLREIAKDDGEFAFPVIDPFKYGGVRNFESKALAKGFANRSAVLCELNLFEKCIQDIELSLEYGYPEDLRSKLYSRKQKCIESLNSGLEYQPKVKKHRFGNAKIADKLKQKNLDYFEEHMVGICEMPNECTNISLQDRLCAKLEDLPEVLNRNTRMCSLSNSVKIFHKEGQGRGLMAVKDIEIFEVLGVERAAVCGLEGGELKTKCSTCFSPCLTPLPCPGCSQVIFCSKLCRTRGLAEDHWLECKILPQLHSDGINEMYSCMYKMTKTLSYKKLKALSKEIDKEKSPRPENNGFSKEGVYSATSYKTIHYLAKVPIESQCEEYPALVMDCLHSLMITKYLVLSGRFFISDSDDPFIPSKEEFLDTCALLMENMSRRAVNSFGERDGKDQKWTVYPSLSLINHSCNPSVRLGCFGRMGYVFAMRPIRKGEELTITYGIVYEEMGKQERQRILMKDYNFLCRCEACKGNWQPGHNPEDRLRYIPFFKLAGINVHPV